MRSILEFAYLSAVLKGLRKLNMYELSCPTTDVGVCSGMIPVIQIVSVNVRFK
jgi:hypothetical protein